MSEDFDTDELWNGHCNRTAEIIKSDTDFIECGGRILYTCGEPLMDNEESDNCYHVFMFINNKFYDASCPNGVDYMSELPVFDGFTEEDAHYMGYNTREKALRSMTMDITDKFNGSTRISWNKNWN